jgi:hypothetical protein
VRSSESGNEFFSSIKSAEFIYQMVDYKLLKNDFRKMKSLHLL